LGLDIPVEPPTDYLTRAIITCFYYASRGRSYISGMAVMPLPISVKGITDVITAHPVFVDRDILDPCVFALDDEFLSEQRNNSDKG